MRMMLRVGTGLLMMGAGLWAQRGALEIQALRPPSGSGLSQTFSLTISDGNRGADVSTIGLYVTERFNAARPGGACLMYYDRMTGEVRLADDAGGNWRSSAMRAGRPLGN